MWPLSMWLACSRWLNSRRASCPVSALRDWSGHRPVGHPTTSALFFFSFFLWVYSSGAFHSRQVGWISLNFLFTLFFRVDWPALLFARRSAHTPKTAKQNWLILFFFVASLPSLAESAT